MRYFPRHRQPLPGDGPVTTGVTWYENEQQWLKMQSTATDPYELYDSYADWLSGSEQQIRDLRRAGIEVVKVAIVGDDFLAWCRETRQENCRASRAAFVVKTLQDRRSQKGKGTAAS